MKELTIKDLIDSANQFCKQESEFKNKQLFGITDGKAVGTYIEHKFKAFLSKRYTLDNGNSARGIDLPAEKINTDIKVTSIKQPQSSSPFKNAKQILKTPPKLGYLTISNALQWRLQYGRVVALIEKVDGITKIIDKITH